MENIGYDTYFGIHLDKGTQRRRVRQAIRRELSPRQRTVIEGVYFEKLSQAEVARRLGLNRSTVCRTLHRAQSRLRRCLQY